MRVRFTPLAFEAISVATLADPRPEHATVRVPFADFVPTVPTAHRSSHEQLQVDRIGHHPITLLIRMQSVATVGLG